MPSATYKCTQCENTTTISWNMGEQLKQVRCGKCGALMQRQYGNVSLGDVVDDKLLYAADIMLHGALPSGKNKRVF